MAWSTSSSAAPTTRPPSRSSPRRSSSEDGVLIDAVEQAEALWIEGRGLNDLGDFRAAAHALDSARALLEERSGAGDAGAFRLLVRVDVTAALTALELDGYASAAALLTSARARAKAAGAEDLVALTHIQQGVVDARSGSWSAARTELLDAVALFAHLGPVEQCSTLITLGLADLSLRHLDDAVAHLERARTIAAEHSLEAHLFKATHNLGCVHFVTGDVPRALGLMSEADAMPVEVARDRLQLDHAEALMDAGLVDEAGELLRAALDAARAAGHRLDEGDILLDLARCALLREDRVAARRSARQAVAAFRTRQADARRALAELFIAGLDLGEGLDPERALMSAAPWRAAVPRTAEEVEAALVVAEAEVAAGRPEGAGRELDRLAPSATLRLPVRIHTHYLRALVAHETGDDPGFAVTVAAASDLLATAQSTVQSLELRAALAQHAARLAQLDLARSVTSGSAGACIDTIERWRAASARARELTISRDPGTTALLQELRWLSSPMSPASESDPAAREARIVELQGAIAARTRRHDRDEDPTPGADPATETMTHDRLVATLPAGTAYLAFAETDGQVYAVLTDRSGASVLRRLGDRAQVASSVATTRRDLRGRAFAERDPGLRAMLQAALRESRERLGELLLAPLRSELDSCERLVVAPNATLHAVPWTALPALEGRPVTVTPSATRWARHAGGDPLRVRRVSVHTGPGLPGVGAEARDIGRLWSRHVDSGFVGAGFVDAGRVNPVHVSDTEATTTDVATALARDDIVHVAAHGHHAGDNPLFSSLRLHDGPLFAHELVHDVRARHVVLSACDVGQARVRVGGEALGMTAALLAFGVHSVIAAVAPISDEASAAASVRYHERLAEGTDAADALARAVRETPGAEALVAFGSDVSVYSSRVPPSGTPRRSASASDS